MVRDVYGDNGDNGERFAEDVRRRRSMTSASSCESLVASGPAWTGLDGHFRGAAAQLRETVPS